MNSALHFALYVMLLKSNAKRAVQASRYLNNLINWQILFALSVAMYTIFFTNKHQWPKSELRRNLEISKYLI